jgi:hypothetical protein
VGISAKGTSILDQQTTIGAALPDLLKNPQKTIELHVQEDRREFKVEVAGHITMIHLEVQCLVFLAVANSHTIDLAAAMRAQVQFGFH